MKKRICFMAILFAFAMQSVSVWAATQSVTPVYLHYKHTPKLDGMPKPSKSPANYYLSLSVSYNAEDQQLVMQDSSGKIYTYYILNENEEVASQGILNFSSTDNYTIDLGAFVSGAYTLVIVHGGHTFCGTFDVD